MHTLPGDARVIKTNGDEVMIVDQDAQALTGWAMGFQALVTERPESSRGSGFTTKPRCTATATTSAAR